MACSRLTRCCVEHERLGRWLLRHRGVGSSQLRANKHQWGVRILWLGKCREAEVGNRSRTEDEAMRRAPVLEMAKLLTVAHVVTGLHVGVNEARRDLGHPHRHECHETDNGIVCFDQDDRPDGDVRQV